MARWSTVLAALAKHPGSVLSAHNQVNSASASALKGPRHTQGVHIQTQANTCIDNTIRIHP